MQFVNVGGLGLDQQLRAGRPEQLLDPAQECGRVAADADVPVDQQRVMPPALAWQPVEDGAPQCRGTRRAGEQDSHR